MFGVRFALHTYENRGSMSIEQLISPTVPILTPSDTGNKALALMEENKLSQLPVVADDQYIGLVQEDDVINEEEPDGKLATAEIVNFKPAVINGAHPYDALRIVNQMNLTVLPVVDSEHKYLGAITKDTLLKYITETSGMEVTGGIIVLEIAPHNYSLYQIARICENEDVTIISSQMHTTADDMMEVTLKTNRTSLDAVVSSLERHNYTIKAVYGDQKNQEDVMDKYNLLMNYLNM